MSEQAWVPLLGLLANGQAQPFAAVSYGRNITTVTLNAGSAPTDPAGTQFQVNIDGTLQAQVFTLPQNTNSIAIPVSGTGLSVNGGSTLTAVVTAFGGAADVLFWIESTAAAGAADAWVVPTATDLQGAIEAAEWEAFTDSILETNQSDPVPKIITNTVMRIRTAIRTGRKNDLGPAGTIPVGAMDLFLQVAQWYFFKRVKSVAFGDKALESMRREANDEIKAICDGDRIFEAPTTVTETVPSGAIGYDTYVPSAFDEVFVTEDDIPTP
jgi:hypothetical protein